MQYNGSVCDDLGHDAYIPYFDGERPDDIYIPQQPNRNTYTYMKNPDPKVRCWCCGSDMIILSFSGYYWYVDCVCGCGCRNGFGKTEQEALEMWRKIQETRGYYLK